MIYVQCIPCLYMRYSKACMTLFILLPPLSAAHKAPQCGQSGRVQLGWHNGVFHPTSPLPGSVLSWTRCGGVCVYLWSVVGWIIVVTHWYIWIMTFFVTFTAHLRQPLNSQAPDPKEDLWDTLRRLCNPQARFTLFCLTRSYCHTKWHRFRQTGLDRTDWNVSFSFVLLCG